MTGTDRLNEFIAKSTEDSVKPKGMCSKLFWELYNMLVELEIKGNAKNRTVHRSTTKSR